ncbi:hypothetical protein L9F63_005417, partial [Diploptera punctata]
GLIFCILPVSSSRFLQFPTVGGCNATLLKSCPSCGLTIISTLISYFLFLNEYVGSDIAYVVLTINMFYYCFVDSLK